MQFSYRHPWESIVILEDGNKLFPRCPQCNMFVPQEALNRAHPTSEMYWGGTERKRRRLVAEDTEERTERVFLEYWKALLAVHLFKYLGRMLSSSDNNWTEVEQNLRRVQGKWGRLAKIFGREGADRRTAGKFYVAVVQVVILSGSEKWLLNLWMNKYLEGFHHRAVWGMAGMVPSRQ